MAASTVDHSSAANYEEVALEHLSLALEVNFANSSLGGVAKWRVRVVAKGGARAVVLDVKRLEIGGIAIDGEAVEPATVAESDVLGTALSVPIPAAKATHGTTFELAIEYVATSASTAVQWLPPEQTAGKKHPYMFTQCQAIHARALVPCHDSPSAKFTYDAALRVPSWATALMSARRAGDGATKGGEAGLHEFRFEQPVSIPSYLLAIAVGELEGRPIGPRSTAWSEPSMIEAVASEFGQDTEGFLQHAEAISGEPYAWGIYDVLCLPPSFPYGGMENPCLTFCTPTLLAGDRSLVGVIAHEIAHSWTGNLITNKTWEHFWLNEGWTVWLERHILARAAGDPKILDLHALSGLKALREDVVGHLGADSPLTCLVPDLSADMDPDDAFSRVPYEKGFNLLCHLADVAGGDAKFLSFFQAYVQRFKRQTVTSDQFRACFLDWCAEGGVDASRVDWSGWFKAPGMPAVTRAFDASLTDACTALARRWAAGDTAACAASDVHGWSSLQRCLLLDALHEDAAAPAGAPAALCDESALRRLGELYGFAGGSAGGRVNCEEAFRYYRLCIACGAAFVREDTLKFLRSNGRMKYVRPLYRALFSREETREAALQTFQAWRANYHPIAQHMLAQDLKLR